MSMYIIYKEFIKKISYRNQKDVGIMGDEATG